MKKVFSVILALAMLVCATASLVLINAYGVEVPGDERDPVGDVDWSYDSETGTLYFSGSGAMTDYCYYNDYLSPWHEYANDITKVVIGEGITYIGAHSFENCEYLAQVEIPDTVIGIGEGAFLGCAALDSVSFPASLKTVEQYAFYNSGIKSAYLRGSRWDDVIILPPNDELIDAEVVSEDETLRGDLNGDGKVTSADSNLLTKVMLGVLVPEGSQKTAADIDGDGKTTVSDMVRMLKSLST